jgi:hypothetical protein
MFIKESRKHESIAHSYFTKCFDVNGELLICTFLDEKGIVIKMLFLKRNMKVIEVFASDWNNLEEEALLEIEV